MIKIDASQLQAFITCPKLYSNQYLNKLVKAREDESEMDRNFGSCIHSGLAILYKGGTMEEAKKHMLTMTNLVNEKIKTVENGQTLLEQYWNYWNKPMNDLSNNKFEVLEIEKVMEFPINDEITWLVKLDTVIKHQAGIFSLEKKTTGDIPYNYFLQFDPNMQLSGQCYAIQQKYGQCSGVIVDVLGCGSRQRKYLDKPAGFWTDFKREIVNRNSEQLEDFKQDVVRWVERLKQAIDTNSFPRNTKACHQYRGCSYRQLCIGVDDENIQEVLYRKIDNPLEYLK